MKFSLSGRIIEVDYKYCQMDVGQFGELAKQAGYDAVELRRTQIDAKTKPEEVAQMAAAFNKSGIGVSRIPAEAVTDAKSLKALSKFADMAVELGCPYLAGGFKEIPWIQKACDYLKERGLAMVIQVHTGGPFETPELAIKTLNEIDRSNFGLMYDPANIFEKDIDYVKPVERLKDHLFIVSVQDICRVDEAADGTWENEGRHYGKHLFGTPGGIDFPRVFDALEKINFDGYVTVIEPISDLMNNLDLADYMCRQLKKMTSRV
ncbi:MAG: sugar phosphate isomerase/epimerase family protein [Planctomycetota bacterium]|nr:sugar phosphate isomerase/epimerase family protein [Planctomycetota bacterium]